MPPPWDVVVDPVGTFREGDCLERGLVEVPGDHILALGQSKVGLGWPQQVPYLA